MLKLTAKKELWTIDALHGTEYDSAFSKIRKEVLERDKHTCQYCGFHSKHHMEVHHVDHRHDNNALSNLKTACPLCHQVFHLPTVSLLNGGTIIFMPELSQAELNNLCIFMFLGMENKKLRDFMMSAYTELLNRKDFIDNYLTKIANSSDVGLFSEMLINVEGNPALLDQINQYFRLLPSKSRFIQQIRSWADEYQINAKENHFFQRFEREKFKPIFDLIEAKTNR